MSCLRERRSAASIAMTRPRVGWAGEVGPGGARGGEIFARTRIFPRVGIERIIASRDLACVSTFIGSELPFCMGARVSGAEG